MCVCVCVCVGWLKHTCGHPGCISRFHPEPPRAAPSVTVGSRAEPSPPQVRGPWVRSEQKGIWETCIPGIWGRGGFRRTCPLQATDEQLCDEETAGGVPEKFFPECRGQSRDAAGGGLLRSIPLDLPALAPVFWLDNSPGRGAWRAAVRGAAESDTAARTHQAT